MLLILQNILDVDILIIIDMSKHVHVLHFKTVMQSCRVGGQVYVDIVAKFKLRLQVDIYSNQL